MAPTWRQPVNDEKVRADTTFGVVCRGGIAELIMRRDIGLVTGVRARHIVRPILRKISLLSRRSSHGEFRIRLFVELPTFSVVEALKPSARRRK